MSLDFSDRPPIAKPAVAGMARSPFYSSYFCSSIAATRRKVGPLAPAKRPRGKKPLRLNGGPVELI
eukprot:8839365-Pyramimonas_sp.AAC.1